VTTASQVSLPYPNADNLEQWANDELTVLGAPRSQSNVNALMAWANTEGGWFHNDATYNPLNTSLPEPGSTNIPDNPDDIQSYASLESGLEATAATIQQQNMAGIDAALLGGNGSQTLQNGIDNSAWGGYGQSQDQIQGIIDSGSIANPSTSGQDTPVSDSDLTAYLTSSDTTSSTGQPTTIATLGGLGGIKIPAGLPTKIILGVVGIIILLMGLHQLFSSNGAITTVTAPVAAAGSRVKQVAK
jgi:hypothetical protein